MKINKIIVALNLCFLFLSMSSNAQQDAQYSHYMYNTSAINPAYTGSRDVLSILGLYRTQWIGLEGAPETGVFALHSPISERVGLGISFISDKIGPSDESTISGDFSYNIPLNDNYKLYFGVKASVNLLNVDFTKLDIYNPNDPRFQNNVDNQFSPNIGSGLYLQSEKSYLGLSVPFFLETKHYDGEGESVAREKMHFYLMAGYVFNLSDNIKFKPAMLSKIVSGTPLQLDLSANFLFNEKFTAGVAYRLDAAFSGLIGFQITDGLLAGYSYDLDAQKLANYNSGSHEIFLRFELSGSNSSNKKIVSPRFF